MLTRLAALEIPVIAAVNGVAAGAGVTRFTIHARKAWLQGLSYNFV